ncbi:MAG: protein phosphatase 2C domain-containing protein [Lentisphaerota bacterium]
MQDTVKKYTGNDNISPIDVVAGTHVGLVREVNEDSYVYCVKESHENAFVAVADGIGGHDSGDIASRMCSRILLIEWRNRQLWRHSSSEEIRKFLDEEIVKSNEAIYRLNKTFNVQHPMGTTLVAGVFTPNSLIVAHAGDSRCYRMRKNIMEPITQDHSFVAELIKRNIISREESKSHPFAHIISKSIGTNLDFKPEINVFDRKAGDRFLFCSDGANVHLDDAQIEIILNDASNPYEAVKNIIYASLRGGGEDNITALCVFT